MNILILIVGLLVGSFAGFVMAAYGQVRIDKAAIETGVIRLCGELYQVEKVARYMSKGEK